MRNLTTYMSPTTARMPMILAISLAISAGACQRKSDPPTAEPTETVAPKSETSEAGKTPTWTASTFRSNGRVVAIGDVHGDFSALEDALELGGIIDAEGKWAGGDATLVQTGDLLDRGDDERQILNYFEDLAEQAKAAGGQVVSLNGNHEVMNVAGDLRYVTPGGFEEFNDVKGLDLTSPIVQRFPEHARARAAAFLPGGPYAQLLAAKRVIAIVDDTVYVHGGVLHHHVTYGIDDINAQTAAWMRGTRDAPVILQGDDSPIWTRLFSQQAPDCAALDKALDALGVKRMVVGHTPQPQGITSACDEKVWRVDVGMAKHYGGKPAALQIVNGKVTALASP